MKKEDEELYILIKKAKQGDIKATFQIILKFEPLIDKHSYIDDKFNQECKDYIFEKLLRSIKNFKNFK